MFVETPRMVLRMFGALTLRRVWAAAGRFVKRTGVPLAEGDLGEPSGLLESPSPTLSMPHI
jgi:hypothetical protein